MRMPSSLLIGLTSVALVVTSCGGSQNSPSSLTSPLDAPGPKNTDTSQVSVSIHGPLDQFAFYAATEAAKANAVQLHVRSQGAMTTTDPALMATVADDFTVIKRRYAEICRYGHSHEPTSAGAEEANAWKIGLRWCGLEIRLWTVVTNEIRGNLRGVPPTQAQKNLANETYRRAEIQAHAFSVAYQAYRQKRG